MQNCKPSREGGIGMSGLDISPVDGAIASHLGDVVASDGVVFMFCSLLFAM